MQNLVFSRFICLVFKAAALLLALKPMLICKEIYLLDLEIFLKVMNLSSCFAKQFSTTNCNANKVGQKYVFCAIKLYNCMRFDGCTCFLFS